MIESRNFFTGIIISNRIKVSVEDNTVDTNILKNSINFFLGLARSVIRSSNIAIINRGNKVLGIAKWTREHRDRLDIWALVARNSIKLGNIIFIVVFVVVIKELQALHSFYLFRFSFLLKFFFFIIIIIFFVMVLFKIGGSHKHVVVVNVVVRDS